MLRHEFTTCSPGKQPGPGEHLRTGGGQAPGVGKIMIAPCTEFCLQTPHLDPAHAMLVPELMHADGGRAQTQVRPASHSIHSLRRRSPKRAEALPRTTTIHAQPAQTP